MSQVDIKPIIRDIWDWTLGPSAPPLTFEDAADGLFVRSLSWTVLIPPLTTASAPDMIAKQLEHLRFMTLGPSRPEWSGYRYRCCQ